MLVKIGNHLPLVERQNHRIRFDPPWIVHHRDFGQRQCHRFVSKFLTFDFLNLNNTKTFFSGSRDEPARTLRSFFFSRSLISFSNVSN